jgi:2-iminobutanoate/2-iminopropanoate deaminase
MSLHLNQQYTKIIKMNQQGFFFIIYILFATIVIEGCQTNEQRIREIVKEELASSMKRTAILDAYTVGPYSPAQQVGKFLFVSGQIALNQRTGTLENEDIETETRQAMDNLLKVLRNAEFDSTDVIATNVYLKDIADYAKMNNIYGGYFQEGNYPARTTVQVVALPREASVEISAIAFKSK